MFCLQEGCVKGGGGGGGEGVQAYHFKKKGFRARSWRGRPGHVRRGQGRACHRYDFKSPGFLKPDGFSG